MDIGTLNIIKIMILITSINDDIPYIDWLVGCVNSYDEIESQSRKL